jgi:poly [ADP-ribose] polymerase
MHNTHAETHNSFKLEIVDVFECKRQGEEERFMKLHNRMLLWHGSRLTNFVGILSQGLRIAPPEAPSTGYMFGKGVYFADMVSKSANYCFTSRQSPNGLLLLCDVACGDHLELNNSDYNADSRVKQLNKHSTKGCGTTYPNPEQAQKVDDDLLIPCGLPTKGDSSGKSLLYNEFIVYNTSQIRIRSVYYHRCHF